ncbi:DegT/DnrJ/EryC1/StrS family aminotransferase [Euzebya rosea]|uniref:DegT/DnrJ/EryC1/StrS family aminotransferase n=1 Tax=Euzebya rosea TaxID=2052804 RepID=UPI000D3E8E04|nr:DegT/DnrJ/EryC1/StrS family aminotransferase [Euzebya rosea]
MPVTYFPYSEHYKVDRASYQRAIEGVLESGGFILQKALTDFEVAFSDYLEVPSVVGVNNCTDALEIALELLSLPAGGEVLVPSHTFVATAEAIHWAGLKPILVDCGEDHLIDLEHAESLITSRTVALVPVHLNGRAVHPAAIKRLAERHDLRVVEDAAQSVGARVDGLTAGTVGDFGAYSFYPAKLLGAFGDGGALVSRHGDMLPRMRAFRDHGRDETGEIRTWGRNSRMDTVQAAVLSVQLEKYERTVDRRRDIASLYDQELRDLPQLRLPAPPGEEPNRFDVFQNYEIEAHDRDELRDALADQKIGTLLPWGGKALHQLGLPGLSGDCPRTTEVFSRILMLPMNPYMSDADVLEVAAAVRSFYEGPA